MANLENWIAGTASQITVTGDGDGTITLSTPQNIATGSTPTFVSLALTGLTASRLVATNGSKVLESVDISAWIAGTANQITVTDDGDGTATLSTPQDIHSGASPTFVTTTLSGLTASRLVATDGSKALASTSASSWIAGTNGDITVTDDGDGSVTLSLDTVWVDVELKPGVVTIPAANFPAEDNIDGFIFHRYDRAAEESVQYVWIIPEAFEQGDNSIKGHFAFVVENPPSGGGDEAVVMGFEYKKISPDAVFDFTAGTSSGTITETITDGETAYIIHTTSDGTLTTTGWQPHDTVLFRFYRDATNPNDTYDNEAVPADNDVWVLNYHLQYLSNKRGEAV